MSRRLLRMNNYDTVPRDYVIRNALLDALNRHFPGVVADAHYFDGAVHIAYAPSTQHSQKQTVSAFVASFQSPLIYKTNQRCVTHHGASESSNSLVFLPMITCILPNEESNGATLDSLKTVVQYTVMNPDVLQLEYFTVGIQLINATDNSVVFTKEINATQILQGLKQDVHTLTVFESLQLHDLNIQLPQHDTIWHVCTKVSDMRVSVKLHCLQQIYCDVSH